MVIVGHDKICAIKLQMKYNLSYFWNFISVFFDICLVVMKNNLSFIAVVVKSRAVTNCRYR